MAARRTRNTAPVETTEVQAPEAEEAPVITTEDDHMPVDDVVEVEATENDAPRSKPGRKVDPLNAAITRVKEAKSALELARKAVPLDQAEAEFDAAKSDLEAQLSAL